jgi:hypothetical protein
LPPVKLQADASNPAIWTDMANRLRQFGSMLGFVVVALLAVVSGAWGALALWFQLPGGNLVRGTGSVLWVLVVLGLAALAMYRRSWLPLGLYVIAFAALLLWWSSIKPSNDRVWADDVARPLTGSVKGNQVTLDNVRDFRWRADDDYDAHWEKRHYDLDHLRTADAVLSYWGSRAIAHAMISFGFDDGSHVVFSVEIRKRRGQQYSALGGFFREFETILVAADEKDIIRVRTNVRGEDDYLYPMHFDQAGMRALFLSYVQAGNQLAAKPAFYNTLTSNCTTIVYRMARHIDPALHWDVRLLLTGYLPGYLQKIGVVDAALSTDELRRRARITHRALQSAPQDDFSNDIRASR